METDALDYSTNNGRFIDLKPLDAFNRLLMMSVIALIEAGKMARVVKLAAKLNRLVWCFANLSIRDALVSLKLAMLLNTFWRERFAKKRLAGMSE